MKKNILQLFTLVLLFVSTSVFADHHKEEDTELKIAMDFSGDKLRVSSVKLKTHKNRLATLRIVLNNKRKRKEISDDDYKVKIELIEECEHECFVIDEDIIKLTAVIKIKQQVSPNTSIEIQLGDDDKKENHHHEDKHHHHEDDHHKHKHKDNCPACRGEDHPGNHKHHHDENEQ